MPPQRAREFRALTSTSLHPSAREPSRSEARVETGTETGPEPSEGSYGRAVRLVGYRAEQKALHELLDSVRAGISCAVVIRGDPGAGKSALLQEAVDAASDMQVVRIVAVESERALAFAGVHQLLLPLLPVADRLPEPQKRALQVAFGEISGPSADPFLVGLAVLTLLSQAAESRPLLCVIDDAQWLDDESANILCFVARRLLADSVAIIVAAEETTGQVRLPELPEIRLGGLSAANAGELLSAQAGQPVDGGVTERLVAETGGNPLALLEVAGDLSPDQLAGRAPLPEPLPIGHRLEESFARRNRELPPATRTLLLLAAADHPGRSGRLWRAAAALGIAESASVAAEEAGVAVFWPEVRFTHPLVRSAVYATATTIQRRQAHQTLAAASDGEGTTTSGRGTWLPPRPGPTRRPRPSRRRPRNGPGAEADTRPKRPSSSAPRCSPASPRGAPSAVCRRLRHSSWPEWSAGPTICSLRRPPRCRIRSPRRRPPA